MAAAQPTTNVEKATTSSSNQQVTAGVINEFEPPLACIRRILKNSLPKSTNVGKDASLAFSRACGFFCIYLATCANDFARESKRQTITANDIFAAMKELDFDEFIPQLEQFLQEHRKDEKWKKDGESKAAAEEESTKGEIKEKEKEGEEDFNESREIDEDEDEITKNGRKTRKSKAAAEKESTKGEIKEKEKEGEEDFNESREIDEDEDEIEEDGKPSAMDTSAEYGDDDEAALNDVEDEGQIEEYDEEGENSFEAEDIEED
eukprot:CAMPEP_0172434090 /NCGR_PEP_ID=MMETSP1064-20121228/70448_1 /TAXON_ID=202472 /ORGANISM="Aulacoseira subarctica , Strain CCAP 1002/5" /LENGTH=261 /DNA_ID=CAMNT_0013182289 /DNA_START=31 /DNA_END=817 /DNA_ORIENTATION=+